MDSSWSFLCAALMVCIAGAVLTAVLAQRGYGQTSGGVDLFVLFMQTSFHILATSLGTVFWRISVRQ